MLYFAYGMNTNPREMATRCPGSRSLGRAQLVNHSFRFAQHADVELCEGETHSFQVPLKGVTTFYGRDRGEKGTDFAVDHSFEDFLERADGCGAEFYYIMKDGEWYVGTTYGSDAQLGSKLVPLAEALADEAINNNELTESVLIKG